MFVRQFTPNDFQAVKEIYALSKLDELCFEDATYQLLPLDQDSRRLRLFTESEVCVFDQGGVKGFGAFYQNEIRFLFIHPNERGKGVGKRLLASMLDRIDGKAKLIIASSNRPARELYERFGFEVVRHFVTDYNGIDVAVSEMVREKFTR